jgi:hypothetical protein
MWNQQNADVAWEQNIGAQGNQNHDGWGQWPAEAPIQQLDDYRGVSFRALTGYDGPSMMDGIVPASNTSDNPAAWSPDSDFFSDLEAAADSVVNGAPSGSLSFSRAAGDNVEMEVEAVPVAHEGIASHTSLNSILLVYVADLQFTVSNFSAMILFFSSKVYPRYKGLEEGEEHVPVQGLTLSLASIESQLSALLRDSLTYVVVVTFQSGKLIEDLALKFEVQRLFNHQHFSWAKALGGLRLDDGGKIFWVGLSSNSGPGSVSFAC